jgi:uncharacterized protein YutD
MPTEDKQNKKGFFAMLGEYFKGFEGSGCACNCLKTVWEKQAKEEAEKNGPEEHEPQEH